MPDDFREVVDRCLAGDETAAADLVGRYQGEVFGLCYRMLRHRQDAEDMAQESFVRALRSLSSWDPERDFKPWLLAIAGNRCRSLLAVRTRRPRPTDVVDDLPDKTPDPRPAQQLAEEVELALGRLRDDHRLAFLMFHEHHFSYAQIAEALACPLGTVKTWVHRARRELADSLYERGVVEELPDAMRRV